jgi:hypothetical protein
MVLFGPVPSDDCAIARWVWGDLGRDTSRAADQYLGKHHIGGSWAYLKVPALLKVAMLGMVQYRLLLYGEQCFGLLKGCSLQLEGLSCLSFLAVFLHGLHPSAQLTWMQTCSRSVALRLRH